MSWDYWVARYYFWSSTRWIWTCFYFHTSVLEVIQSVQLHIKLPKLQNHIFKNFAIRHWEIRPICVCLQDVVVTLCSLSVVVWLHPKRLKEVMMLPFCLVGMLWLLCWQKMAFKYIILRREQIWLQDGICFGSRRLPHFWTSVICVSRQCFDLFWYYVTFSNVCCMFHICFTCFSTCSGKQSWSKSYGCHRFCHVGSYAFSGLAVLANTLRLKHDADMLACLSGKYEYRRNGVNNENCSSI